MVFLSGAQGSTPSLRRAGSVPCGTEEPPPGHKSPPPAPSPGPGLLHLMHRRIYGRECPASQGHVDSRTPAVLPEAWRERAGQRRPS